MELIGGLLGIILFLIVVFVGGTLFLTIIAASLFLGAIYGFIRGFFFMIQALLTDVLDIGNF